MLTIAEIATLAFDGVSAEVSDAIHAATLSHKAAGTYDPGAAAFLTTATVQTGRAVVDTATPAIRVFPDYVAADGDELILLEGLTDAAVGDVLTFAGRTRHVMAVQDILAAGALFYVVAR